MRVIVQKDDGTAVYSVDVPIPFGDCVVGTRPYRDQVVDCRRAMAMAAESLLIVACEHRQEDSAASEEITKAAANLERVRNG